MATSIRMKNKYTGAIINGFYGFSWTTFFFSGFSALFRGDIFVGVAALAGSVLTGWIFSFIWAFFYNKHYTLRLLENGYEFHDTESAVRRARVKLGLGHACPYPPGPDGFNL